MLLLVKMLYFECFVKRAIILQKHSDEKKMHRFWRIVAFGLSHGWWLFYWLCFLVGLLYYIGEILLRRSVCQNLVILVPLGVLG